MYLYPVKAEPRVQINRTDKSIRSNPITKWPCGISVFSTLSDRRISIFSTLSDVHHIDLTSEHIVTHFHITWSGI